MATTKQIVIQTQFEGYDIDVLSSTYANGYTCYEYVISDEEQKWTESEEGYLHPDDALDGAIFFLTVDIDGDFLQQRQAVTHIASEAEIIVIGFDLYIVTISADEVRVNKEGASEKSFKRQDLLASDDLMKLRRDPVGTIIERYETGE